MEPVLIDGKWRQAQPVGSFRAVDPSTRAPLAKQYPVSSWADCDAALSAADTAARQMVTLPPSVVADFLDHYAHRLDDHAALICEQAHRETALPLKPRLLDVELPRTTRQLRLAAAAASEGSWRMSTIDTTNDLRSCYGPLGPVAVFGPNNFPLAFQGISGGDFAAAIAAGNPVIAKANPSHPRTTQLVAEQAALAAESSGLPSGAVQLLYRMAKEDGRRLVQDRRLGAVAFTGSRPAGLALKAAADAVGKPIYLEMSSVNAVFFLPGVVLERRAMLVDELADSCLLGTGQFCTCPNLFVLFAGDESFLADLKSQFDSRPAGLLLSDRVLDTLRQSIESLVHAGAELVTGGRPAESPGFGFQNTLLRVSGTQFLHAPDKLQTEAFGNATLAVVVDDVEQACQVVEHLDGSLTGSLYSASDGVDDALYDQIAPALRRRVGRLLNNRMPTGVAVSPAMNHGGPFPATGHPGFTAVGIPASMRRFAMLECYDHVRPSRLPHWLQDSPPGGGMWRSIDGRWTQGSVEEP